MSNTDYITYASVADAYYALAVAAVVGDNGNVDANMLLCLQAASRSVEEFLDRKFYPTFSDTKYLDWPQHGRGRGDILKLEDFDLLELTTLTVGGDVFTSDQYSLEPINSGPPYTRIKLFTNTFYSGTSRRNAIQIDGTTGYTQDVATAGTLAGDINSSTTSIGGAYTVGGAVLKVGTEWMICSATGVALRGQLGSTAAAHLTGDTVYQLQVPPLVKSLTIAEANVLMESQATAWAQIVGAGDAAFEPRRLNLKDLREKVRRAHGRKFITGAI